MTKVEHLNQLSDPVMYFTGKSLDDALKSAEEWAGRRNAEIGRYYVQFSGRSIIADYASQTLTEL